MPARRSFDLEALQQVGTLTADDVDLLRGLLRARAAFVVTGGTGSGKTTLLSSMLSSLGADERIVVVEDATELRPDHPHVVGLEARPANIEGSGLVTVRDLVRQALRMRPDRVVVGEVRGPEVVDLMAALNTGHEGGCGTLHANAPADVPARFEALGVAAGLTRDAVHSQLAAGLDVVLHVGRDRAGRRVLAEVGIVRADDTGLVRVHAAVTRRGERSERGPGWPALERILVRGV